MGTCVILRLTNKKDHSGRSLGGRREGGDSTSEIEQEESHLAPECVCVCPVCLCMLMKPPGWGSRVPNTQTFD